MEFKVTPQVATLQDRPAQPLRALSVLILGAVFLVAQALQGSAQDRPATFADLADQVSPAVVNITTATTVAASTGNGPIVPEGSPFDDFFRDFMERNGPGNQQRRPRRSSALGSGFVISADGYIVTNNHVIESADEITIEFFSGGELDATVVGTDPNTDIALLKVESDEPLPFVEFGSSDAMRVGDWVMAMGNPLGQGFSVSAGIVSARGRALSGSYDDFIQTDAAINRGNSGGPLFNLDGEVIGVNTAILSPNGGSIGIGFAMASDVVTNVVDQLQEFGETRRGWLGVRIQDVTEELAEALELEQARGALITDVPEGPAREAGIEARDVILTFDGVEVEDTRELVQIVGNSPVGAVVPVIVWRDGEEVTIDVTLARREEAEAIPASQSQSEPEEPAQKDVMGLTLSAITDELREQLGLSEDASGIVVVDVDETTEAYEKGLRAGDLITEAGQQQVATVAAFEGRIEEAEEAGRKSLLLLVRRSGEPRFVALSLD